MAEPEIPVPTHMKPLRPEEYPVAPKEPEIRRPDLQMLLQDLATANRTLFEERRQADRRIAEERERGRWEAGRVRAELEEKNRELERQNAVLVRTLGRLQEQNDHLREELAVARARFAATAIPFVEGPARQDSPVLAGEAVPKNLGPFVPSAAAPMALGPKALKVPVIPAKEPDLGGRPITVVEPPGKPPAP